MSNDSNASPTYETLRYNLEIKNPHRVFKWVAVIVMAIVFARNAWVGDDAFITMRVADNFVNGFGLVWNIGERVQVFTSPLWMFLLTLSYAVVRDPYWVMYGLAFALSLLGFWLILKYFSKSYWDTLLLTCMMAGSAAYIDYSSSGLENPLTHLLLICTLIVLLKLELEPLKFVFTLSLLACLAALNRLDTLLFYVPLLGWLLYRQRARWLKALGVMALAFIPLFLWFGFATFYFGFPLPNTYYAKLPSNYPLMYFWNRGIAYYFNSLHWDPLTLMVIVSGIVLAVWNRETRKMVMTAGVVLYLLYGLRIGGDFMSGRFLSAAFVVMVMILFEIDYVRILGAPDRKLYWFVLVGVVAVGISANYPPVLTQTDKGTLLMDADVANERMFYFPGLGLFNHLSGGRPHEYGLQGLDARQAGVSPVKREGIGSFGFYAGPVIYVIDAHALADPLRARLPAPGEQRVGHYNRAVPDGYEETIADNFQNQLADPDLCAYYAKLSLLIHGDLTAPNRLQEILGFNLGRYDNYLRNYEARFK